MIFLIYVHNSKTTYIKKMEEVQYYDFFFWKTTNNCSILLYYKFYLSNVLVAIVSLTDNNVTF